MKLTFSSVTLCLMHWLYFSSAHAEPIIEVGLYNYPPMMIEQENTGIYMEIFYELEQLLGRKFNIRYYPYPRIDWLFGRGQLDIVPGVHPDWVQNQPMLGEFSVPFGRVDDVIVFASGKIFPVKSTADLRGKKIGLVRGYDYPNLRGLVESEQIERFDGRDEVKLLDMLLAMRFDQAVINKAVAEYNIMKFKKYKELEVGDIISSFPVSMRIHARNKDWLPELNQAILKLKKSGAIERIYTKYGVTFERGGDDG